MDTIFNIPELVSNIITHLDYPSWCSSRLTSKLFLVNTTEEVKKRKGEYYATRCLHEEEGKKCLKRRVLLEFPRCVEHIKEVTDNDYIYAIANYQKEFNGNYMDVFRAYEDFIASLSFQINIRQAIDLLLSLAMENIKAHHKSMVTYLRGVFIALKLDGYAPQRIATLQARLDSL